jgi:hypothetical protein
MPGPLPCVMGSLEQSHSSNDHSRLETNESDESRRQFEHWIYLSQIQQGRCYQAVAAAWRVSSAAQDGTSRPGSHQNGSASNMMARLRCPPCHAALSDVVATSLQWPAAWGDVLAYDITPIVTIHHVLSGWTLGSMALLLVPRCQATMHTNKQYHAGR